MGKSIAFTNEQIKNIIRYNLNGMKNIEIASLLGVSDTYIGRICKYGNQAMVGDIQGLAEDLVAYPDRLPVVRNCCAAFGVDFYEVTQKIKELTHPSAPAAEEPVKDGPKPVLDNTALFMVQILSEIKQLNENLLALMDADLPKRFEQIVNAIDSMAHDVEQVVNSNCDVLNKELQVQTLALDKIRKGNRNG